VYVREREKEKEREIHTSIWKFWKKASNAYMYSLMRNNIMGITYQYSYAIIYIYSHVIILWKF